MVVMMIVRMRIMMIKNYKTVCLNCEGVFQRTAELHPLVGHMIKIKTWEQTWPPMAPPANFSLGYCVFIGERQLAGAHYYGRKRHGATADKPPFRRLSTR